MSTSSGQAEPESSVLIKKKIRVRPRRTHWWQRRWARIAAIVLALAGADLAWAGVTAGLNLLHARQDLRLGAEALRGGRLTEAAMRFDQARAAAQGAQGFDWHPTIKLVGAIPGLGNNVDAVLTLGRAAEDAADAGRALTGAATAAGWNGATVPGVKSGGQVDLAVLQAASPGLAGGAASLSDAMSELDAIDQDGLLPPVRSVVASAQSLLATQDRLVASANDLAQLLPGLLGGGGERRYFLAVQNLSAPRGTGGFLGFYGILVAQDGRVSLSTLAPTGPLGDLPAVRAPADVAARYARFGTLTHVLSANYSPDFPTTARLLLEMAPEEDLGRFDGVIAVDTVWMSHVLGAIGPVQSAAWPAPVTEGNISAILDKDTFEGTSPKASNGVQGDIGLDIWHAVLTRSPRVAALGGAMSRSVAEGHLQVYSTDPAEETLLADLGATGHVELGRNPLYVVWQDYSSSRAGFFAGKSTTQTVTLAANGTAAIKTATTLDNQAPTGQPPSLLLGLGRNGFPVGYWGALINVYLPEDATGLQFDFSNGPSVGVQEEEFGRPVGMGLVQADAGKSSTFTLSYTEPSAVTRTEDSLEYRTEYLPQPSLKPVLFTIDFQIPAGMHVTATSPGMQVEGTTVRYEGAPVTAQDFWVQYG